MQLSKNMLLSKKYAMVKKYAIVKKICNSQLSLKNMQLSKKYAIVKKYAMVKKYAIVLEKYQTHFLASLFYPLLIKIQQSLPSFKMLTESKAAVC